MGFIEMVLIVLQASYYMQHQMQLIAQLEDTDRQIRGEIRGEKISNDFLKRLKEARTVYREDLIDCVRKCTWYVAIYQSDPQRAASECCAWY